MWLLTSLIMENIHEFFEFANDIKTLGCDKTDCEIFKFVRPLEEALSNKTCCQHLKTIFINQCIKYANAFNSMFQLNKVRTLKLYLKS